jgi:hypothetical protein
MASGSSYRDRGGGAWEQILVCGADGELSIAELDRLAAIEDPRAKRFQG